MHISFIMDGNGRWATNRNKPRSFGHKEGANTLERILEACPELGVTEATFYAFSTENKGRPKAEVDYLIALFESFLKSKVKKLHQSNVRFRVIGDRGYFGKKINKIIQDAENLTDENKGLNFNLAMNYGGKAEILQTVKRLLEKIESGEISPQSINEDTLNENLDLQSSPDLMIRTGGQYRLSNFLLWQHAYSEFIFVNTLWPDFSVKELREAIQEFKNRNRRFGNI